MNNKTIHPRLKPIYPAYRLNKKIFRIGAQIGITAEFEDQEEQFWLLVSLLDGRPLNEIVSKMKNSFPNLTEEDVLDGISILNKEGFIEETLQGEEEKVGIRYHPNVNYFSHFTDMSGNRFSHQRKINESKILLLGLGGAGSNILALLSGIGPKSITIVDYDTVEEGNLGRQFLYREKDVGKSKVMVAYNAISEMNSEIQIVPIIKKINSANDVHELISDNDIVISAIDEPPFRAQRTVNKAIVEANVPCIFAASQVSRGRVFSVIPGKTGCFDCLNIHYSQRDKQFLSQFVAFSDSNFDPPSIAYGPSIFILAATIVDETVRILTNYTQARSLGLQFELNFEDGSPNSHPAWPRLIKDCPTCGNGDSSSWEIFNHY